MSIWEDELPLTPRCKKLLVMARKIARDNGFNYVGVEHILIALPAVDAGPFLIPNPDPIHDCVERIIGKRKPIQ